METLNAVALALVLLLVGCFVKHRERERSYISTSEWCERMRRLKIGSK